MRAIGRSARSRSRRRTAFASRNPAIAGCSASSSSRSATRQQRSATSNAAWEIRDSVRVLEPGHRLELADTLEALIAVGELGGGRAEARTVGEARPGARPLVGAGDHGPLPRAPPRRAGRFRRAPRRASSARSPSMRGLRIRSSTRAPCSRKGSRSGERSSAARLARRSSRRWPSSSGSAPRFGPRRRRSELARIGGRAPGRGELTEAESRIAALVAEGRTNREVAAALFVTVHTVEGALTRVYRKLGVRSRSELAHRLAQER